MTSVYGDQYSSTVNIHFIMTLHDDEVNMPVSGTRIHPGGITFILLFEHGVCQYQLELGAQIQQKFAIGVAFPDLMLSHNMALSSVSLRILALKLSISSTLWDMSLTTLASAL